MSKTTIPAGGITDGTLTSAKLDQDGAFTFNEDSADADFRVESNGNANMLFVSGGNNVVGIGAEGDLGTGLHIKTADSSASVSADADELVLESNGNTGLTLLGGTSNACRIYFGDSGDNDIGQIRYAHDDNALAFTTNASTRMTITSAGRVGINQNSPDAMLQVDTSDDIHVLKVRNTRSQADGVTKQLLTIDCTADANGGYRLIEASRESNPKFIVEDDGDVLNQNGTYGTTSDERIKENIADANSQWDDIKALKIKNYNLKTDSTAPKQLGVIAQDLESSGMSGLVKETTPEKQHAKINSDFGTVVDGTAENGANKITDSEGNVTGYEEKFTEGQKIKTVKTSVLYMKSVKALQEAMTRIETLEAKVKALEEA